MEQRSGEDSDFTQLVQDEGSVSPTARRKWSQCRLTSGLRSLPCDRSSSPTCRKARPPPCTSPWRNVPGKPIYHDQTDLAVVGSTAPASSRLERFVRLKNSLWGPTTLDHPLPRRIISAKHSDVSPSVASPTHPRVKTPLEVRARIRTPRSRPSSEYKSNSTPPDKDRYASERRNPTSPTQRCASVKEKSLSTQETPPSVWRAISRVQEYTKRACLKAIEREAPQEEPRRGSLVDVKKSMQMAQNRVVQRQTDPGVKNCVAVIGAGPVGLWTALLLSRQPGAPKIDVFEKRSEEKHGSRNILLCFSLQTESVINKVLSTWRTLAPSILLCELECILRDELGNVPNVRMHWGHEVTVMSDGTTTNSNAEEAEPTKRPRWLSEDSESECGEGAGCINGKRYSAIFVATGKRANEFRQQDMHPTNAIILSYTKEQGKVKDVYAHSILRNGNIIIREFDQTQGWIWLLNYQNDSIDINKKYLSFKEIVDPTHRDSLLFECLEAIAYKGSIGVMNTVTGYWGICKNDPIVFETRRDNGTIVCYVGDSCCGKPFYLGTTLQFHIYDMVFLITGIQWRQNAHAQWAHFLAYDARMRARIQSFMAKKMVDNVPITDVIDAHARSCSPNRAANRGKSPRGSGKDVSSPKNLTSNHSSPNRTLTDEAASKGVNRKNTSRGSPARCQSRGTKRLSKSPSNRSRGNAAHVSTTDAEGRDELAG